MSLKVDRVQLEIEINNDPIRKNLRELEDQINNTRKSMSNIKKSSPEYAEQDKQLKSLIKDYDTLINKIGINEMSINELRKRQKDLNAILRNMPPTNENYGAYKDEITKVNNRLKELRTTAKDTNVSLSKFGKDDIPKVNNSLKELRTTAKDANVSLSKFGMAFQVFAGNMLTKAVSGISDFISKAKEFVKEGINMADKSEGIVKAFNKLNSPDLLKNLRKETKGLDSDLKLMQLSVKADKLGIPLNTLASLLKFAQQRAQETGESIDYLVDSIVNGIGRKSTLILDNLGISASRIQSEVKKTGDFTTAAIKIVNEELEKQGDLALTTGDKKTETDVKWENAQLKLGRTFQWIGNLWNKISGGMADRISEITGDTRSLNDKYNDQVNKVAELELHTKSLAERYDELKKKTNLNKDEQIELNKIMNSISSAIPGVISEWDAYGNILSINTEKVYDFIEAEKAKLAYLNRETIEQTQTDIIDYNKKTKEAREKYKKGYWEKTITDRKHGETYTVKYYYTDEEMKQLEQDIKTYGDKLKKAISANKALTGKSIETQIKQQKEMLKIKSDFNAMNKKELETWIKDEKNAASKNLDIAKQIYNQRFGVISPEYKGNPDKDNSSTKERAKLNQLLKDLEENHLKEMKDIKTKYLNGDLISEEDYQSKLIEQQDKYDGIKKQKLKELSDSITDPTIKLDIAKQIAEIEVKALDKQILDKEKKQKDQAKKELDILKWNEEETKKIIDESLKYILTEEDKAYIKQMELRIKGELSEIEYQKSLNDIQKKYLEERLKVIGLSEKEIAEISRKIFENQIADIQELDNKRSSLFNNDLSIQVMNDMKSIDEALLSGAITFGEAVMLRVESYISAANVMIEQVGNNLSGAWSNYQSAEESSISRRYDKQIKAAEGNSKKQKKLEEQKQKEINDIRAKYADKQFAVSVAQTISSTSVAAIEAYKAMAGIPFVGPILGAAAAAAAIAYGNSQIAVAKEQRNAAKEGYQSGGYTSKYYRDDKAVGTVHANEFVANADAVRNPEVRKFLDVFNVAQKNGTIHLLDTTKILEKVRIESNSSFPSSKYAIDTTSNNNLDNSLLLEIINNNTLMMQNLNDKLDQGIKAYSIISGDNGSYKQTERYKSLLANATRVNY